jgi:hypothetical protein
VIENLPLLTSDAARTAATMARCHATLAARRRRIETRNRPNPKVIAAERLFVAGLCLAYLISMAGNVFRVIGPP